MPADRVDQTTAPGVLRNHEARIRALEATPSGGIQFGGPPFSYGPQNLGGYLDVTTNVQDSFGWGFDLLDLSEGGFLVATGFFDVPTVGLGSLVLIDGIGRGINIIEQTAGAAGIIIAAGTTQPYEFPGGGQNSPIVIASDGGSGAPTVMVGINGPAGDSFEVYDITDATKIYARIFKDSFRGAIATDNFEDNGNGLNIIANNGGINLEDKSGIGIFLFTPVGNPSGQFFLDQGSGGFFFQNDGTGEIFFQDTSGNPTFFDAPGGFEVNLQSFGGNFTIDNLPTTNPGGAGNLWNNGGVVNIT